jgi:hypothetical protein
VGSTSHLQTHYTVKRFVLLLVQVNFYTNEICSLAKKYHSLDFFFFEHFEILVEAFGTLYA